MDWPASVSFLKIPYGESATGFWGEQTSTLNFCEEDYVLSRYCAEVCNTITNAIFIWLGARGVKNCLTCSHPTIFLIAFVGYLIVGVGSLLFHSTLKYPMQLVDELSMIYTTCLMAFASFSFKRPPIFQVYLGVFLVAIAGFITLYYHLTQNPVFHQVAYGILTVTVLGRCMWVMETTLRPMLKGKGIRCEQVMQQMWSMVWYGIIVFLAGFIIWNLDNVYCNTIRGWRHSIGLPWAVILEGHAWWHLMTGIGAYFYIVWGIWLRRGLEDKTDEFELRWPSMFMSLPEVQQRSLDQKKQD